MNVLVLGSGGREHSLAWKIKQSPKCQQLFIAPGNGGTHSLGENLAVDVDDAASVKSIIVEHAIDLVVFGPENPLVNGVTDVLRADKELGHVLIVGPNSAGAKLEGSKEFAKDFMYRYGIPTAKAKAFEEKDLQEGLTYLEESEGPYVLKADGLAAGKGVVITESLEEAKEVLEKMLVEKPFGAASSTVLIEQFLKGIELSVFVLTDGEHYVLLPEAKDYKRIGEGDTGPNTGGMGAVSPVKFANPAFMEKVHSRIIKPTLAGLQEDGINYSGFIFFGLINVSNDPYVIEYNVRLGDPESEAILPRVTNDFLELLEATAKGDLEGHKAEIAPYASVTLMMVSGGYPGPYEKGKPITIKGDLKGVIPFHAGTKLEGSSLLTNGGRVMTITSLGKNLLEAITKGYEATKMVEWEGKTMRDDIGEDLHQFN